MGIFDFLRKNEEDVPPDIGKEETGNEEVDDFEKGFSKNKKEDEETEEKPDKNVKLKSVKKLPSNKKPIFTVSKDRIVPFNSERDMKSDSSSLEHEKTSARLETINNMLKEYSERFSRLSGQIGEVRAMTLNNEKSISKISQESARTVDIVKEVKPENMRADYMRADTRISVLNERIEANSQFQETIMNEIKDLRRKAGVFVGTEALLKLNEDVKKDLIELQHLNSKVKMHADKSEQIFIEFNKNFQESKKIEADSKALQQSFSNVKGDVERMKVDFSKIVSQDDFLEFQQNFEVKMKILENALSGMEKLKDENNRLANILESTILLAKKNENDIASIGVTLGKENIKGVADLDVRIDSILNLMDSLASQVRFLKNKVRRLEQGDISNKEVEKKPVEKKKEVKRIDFDKMESLLKPKAQKPTEILETGEEKPAEEAKIEATEEIKKAKPKKKIIKKKKVEEKPEENMFDTEMATREATEETTY